MTGVVSGSLFLELTNQIMKINKNVEKNEAILKFLTQFLYQAICT